MVKKIVVAGCRNYENYEEAKKHIEACIQELKSRYDLLFLSGGCKGADRLGEQYAKENGFPVEVFSADWKKYGKAAGPKRNQKMAEAADLVLCFWDGKSRGTASMISCAEKFKKPLIIIHI
ncbi:MAG: DUF2493 domain-containing protein [Clostridia bacterium]|nr:DUF2493 domain-containing protein [Clostridia bacterium]